MQIANYGEVLLLKINKFDLSVEFELKKHENVVNIRLIQRKQCEGSCNILCDYGN